MACTILGQQTISTIQSPITASTSGSPARDAIALNLSVKPPEQPAMRTGLLVVVDGDIVHLSEVFSLVLINAKNIAPDNLFASGSPLSHFAFI